MELANKKEELQKIEARIKKLNAKRSKLLKEIEIMEMRKKVNDFEALEISLKEKGLTLQELLNTLN